MSDPAFVERLFVTQVLEQRKIAVVGEADDALLPHRNSLGMKQDEVWTINENTKTEELQKVVLLILLIDLAAAQDEIVKRKRDTESV
jgi:hypothetical protein